MIYLLAVSHDFQSGKDKNLSSKLEKFVETFVEEQKIDVIAEEWSKDASDQNGLDRSVLEGLALSLSVKYKRCDPTVEERKKYGYVFNVKKPTFDGSVDYISKLIDWQRKKNEIDHIRELFWLKKLEPLKPSEKNILFVCGAMHLSTNSPKNLLFKDTDGFDLKLAQRKITYEIVNKSFVSIETEFF